MYRLGFYVPASHVEVVKSACFAAGAGRKGDYDHCCWQVLGEGQFRPLPGSNPHTGSTHALETVAQYRVEMVCDDAIIADVVAAMLAAHPFEVPAYDVVAMVTVFDQ
ncbi:MAG: NGG1p interacting factor NIF3 [Pseudomonadota bacterium]